MKLKKLEDIILKYGILSWVLLLAAWQIGSMFYSDEFLPGILTTLRGAADLIKSGDLQEDFLISFWRILRSWSLAMCFAIPAGLCIGFFKLPGRLFEPLVNFFRFIPAISLVTLVMMWFGVGESAKTVLIFYAAIFPIMINAIAGARSAPQHLVEAAQLLGASRFHIFFYIVVPAAVPYIFTGIRLGLSSSMICIVSAEMLAASSGIGHLIYTARLYYRTDWILIGIFVLGFSGFLADKLLQFAGRKFLYRYGVR